jgi:deoxyribose-phosphate aldolase
MTLTTHDIARMLDVSAVKAQSNEADIREMVAMAKEHRCIACFTLPAMTPFLAELLAGEDDILIGGVAGFPDGAHSTAVKAKEAADAVALGAGEVDMVMNVGFMKSGWLDKVRDDIQAVADACGEVPLKVILECHHLTDDEMRKACELCMDAGAAWVKTGTGWTETGATPERIALMKSVVGDRCQVKASGGVRSLDGLVELYRLGATRFGVGAGSGADIINEVIARGGSVEV